MFIKDNKEPSDYFKTIVSTETILGLFLWYIYQNVGNKTKSTNGLYDLNLYFMFSENFHLCY